MFLSKYIDRAIVLVVGLMVAGLAEQKFRQEYSTALTAYRTAATQDLQRNAVGIQSAFQHIYENLRTISELPSVRKIDRHGTNIDADARMSIQQIYNNLANSVDVSEVYIVPGDLKPDTIDSTTGKPEEPILSFDELITGKGDQVSKASPEISMEHIGLTSNSANGDEDYEYHQLVNHMSFFKSKFPTNQSFSKLEVPTISGPEILTCDNTKYQWTRDDADRKGVMISVPFYGDDGLFKGTITATIRTDALKALIPDHDFSLANTAHGYVAPSREVGQQNDSADWIRQAKPDPTLLFSDVVPIDFKDLSGHWALWAGHSNRDFLASAEVKRIANDRLLTDLSIFVVCLGALFALLKLRQRRQTELGQWQDLSNATIEGLMVCDKDIILTCNRAMNELLEVKSESLKITSLTYIVPDQILREQLFAPDGASVETLLNKPGDSSQLPVEIISRPIAYHGQSRTALAVRDISERKLAEQAIHLLVVQDPLTHLANRRGFQQDMVKALARAERGDNFAVLCIDLDHFKQVNDTLGHALGDKLLEAVATRLGASVRKSDSVARIGGDEFAVIQHSADQPEKACKLAERLVEELSRPYQIDGHQVVIGASVGIALAPNDGKNPDELLMHADLALYRAKADGRGAFRMFEVGMDAKIQARRKLELDLRQALTLDQYELFYQPLVDTASQDVTGFEALLRWRHPERGLVPPLDFIPALEEMGMMGNVGAWILKQACLDARAWPVGTRVAVNISAAQFKGRCLEHDVRNALENSGIDPKRLELEITESVLLETTEATTELLHKLRATGVRIAMDDFGTGYSSLSYLSSFPFDKIKIDRSFISGGATNEKKQAIVQAVLGLGASLSMSTTAEGVETVEQFERLKLAGCTEAQGYLFSKPVPAKDVAALLTRLDTNRMAA